MTPNLIPNLIPTRAPVPRRCRLAAALIAAVLFGGCAETLEQPEPQPPVSARPLITAPAATTVSQEPQRPSYRGPWDDPSNPLYHRTIYFDYDSAAIEPQYLDVIRIHGVYLGKNSGQRVTLDGNTDERGTREYNLALGDRRAEAVRQLMLAEGVAPDQLATLSYGEERPADPAHTEGAWRLNRRVIIQY